jgi:hypothetical protein
VSHFFAVLNVAMLNVVASYKYGYVHLGDKADSTPLDNVYRTGQAVGYFTFLHIFHKAVNTFIGE